MKWNLRLAAATRRENSGSATAGPPRFSAQGDLHERDTSTYMAHFGNGSDWARVQRYQHLWPVWRSVAAAGIVGALSFIASISAIWLLMDRPDVAVRSLTAAEQFDLVRIGLIVTGGIGGLIALVVAYRRQRITERADARGEMATREANYKLFNELFNSTSLLLGNPSAAVRLAGVYGMTDLADAWPAFRRLCVEVLCAYLRTPIYGDEEARHADQEVRESLLRVLEERVETEAWSTGKIYFSSMDWTGMSPAQILCLREHLRPSQAESS